MEALHFLRPWALLGFLAVAYCAVKMWNASNSKGLWQKVCDPRLLPFVLLNRSGPKSRWPVWAFVWLSSLAVLALAGPAWRKEPAAVYLKTAPLVVLLDLSTSMYAQDEQPSRYERALLKVRDILNLRREGQIGLVVFSSLPFVVTPLTTDNEAVRVLLNPLAPNILPVTGKRVQVALMKAQELLSNAGAKEGQVLLIGDNAEPAALIAAGDLRRAGFSVSVLAVGSDQGVPIIVKGQAVMHQGKPMLVRTNLRMLEDLARQGGGVFQRATPGEQDITRLLKLSPESLAHARIVSGASSLRWRDEGRWLLLGLLPLVALGFRRGWLAGVCLFVLPGLQQSAEAFEWRSLWQNSDQLGLHHYQQKNYSQALKWFADPNWQASARYKVGDFKGALEGYAQDHGASGHYNRGNSLVQLGRYSEALTEYETALAKNPQHPHARTNRDLVKKFLESQKKTSDTQSTKSDSKAKDGAKKGANPQKNGQTDPSAQDEGKKNSEDPQDGPTDANAKNDAQKEAANKQERSSSLRRDNNPQAEAKESKNSQNQGDQESKPQASDGNKKDENSLGKEKSQANTNKLGRADPKDSTKSDTLDAEGLQASEQWLQQIRDDPGRLLRRKFFLQYLKEKSKYSSSFGLGSEE